MKRIALAGPDTHNLIISYWATIPSLFVELRKLTTNHTINRYRILKINKKYMQSCTKIVSPRAYNKITATDIWDMWSERSLYCPFNCCYF